jgi:hypothetical protein
MEHKPVICIHQSSPQTRLQLRLESQSQGNDRAVIYVSERDGKVTLGGAEPDFMEGNRLILSIALAYFHQSHDFISHVQ